MNLIVKLLRLLTPKPDSQKPGSNSDEQKLVRNPRNVPGDFYVVCESCVHCGAPEAEAPDLMEMDDDGCYFKKQPSTPDEVCRAINAVAVSCVSAVRYGGVDKDIIKRLSDFGCANECDFKI